MIDFEALAAPFPSDKISWRVGSTNKKKMQQQNGNDAHATKGIALAYIDARDVMDRLDDICGPNNWRDAYSHAGQRVICDLGIKCGDEWVTKANGAGDTQVEKDKGAISDAFKRSAVMWGIGRYLYEIENVWVDLAPFGRIKPDQMKILNAAHEKAANMIEWGSPAERAMLKAYIHTVRHQCQTLEDIQIFIDNNAGMYSQFRVKARELVLKTIENSTDAIKAKEVA